MLGNVTTIQPGRWLASNAELLQSGKHPGKINITDVVVTTTMEHHSNIVPWQLLRDRLGVTLKFVEVDEQGRLRVDQYDQLLNSRTKLVAISRLASRPDWMSRIAP